MLDSEQNQENNQSRRSNRLHRKEKRKYDHTILAEQVGSSELDGVDEQQDLGCIARPMRVRKQNYAQSEDFCDEEIEVQVEVGQSHIFRPEIDQLVWRKEEDGSIKYLVKFKDQSYLHTEWLSEDEILQEKNGKQKINRFNKVFDKKLIEDFDEDQYFDSAYGEVDRVLSCTEMFPVIHPKKGSEIKGKWSEGLTLVMSHLLNFTKDGIHYGVYYTDASNTKIPGVKDVSRLSQITVDLTTINNRLYLGYYKSSEEFWNELGQLFTQVRELMEPQSELLVIGDTLRECAIQLYQNWHDQQYQRYQNVIQNQRYLNEYEYRENLNRNHIESVLAELRKEKINEVIVSIINTMEQQEQNLTDHFNEVNEQLEQQYKITLDPNRLDLEVYLKEQLNGQELDLSQEIEQELVDFQKQMSIPELDIEIWNPNELSYSWLGESINDTEYLNSEDRQFLLGEVDRVYLIKWKHLSYIEATWESESLLGCRTKIAEFKQFNRSLDKETRNLMIQQNSKHKMLVEFEQGLRKKKLSNLQAQELKNQLYFLNQKKEPHEYTPLTQTIYKDRKLLRDYQLDSLNWLIRSFYEDRNVILADEMGLGKTIQSIALLNHLYTFENYRGPYLIIAPLSTLSHWKRTVEDWTNLNGVLYYDQEGSGGRKLCRTHEFYYTDISMKGVVLQASEIFKFQVLITSYEVFLLDFQNHFLDIPFQFIIVDEAHKLKNQNARILQALKKMPCHRTLLLTGTPIQNNTEELWSLLNFIEPANFPNQKTFLRDYGQLATSEQVEKLNILLRPFILRRQKEDVEQMIPPLQETIIDIEMTTIQKTIYKALYERNKNMLEHGFSQWAANATQLNNLEIQLRKCCNHPFLITEMHNELQRGCRDYNEYIDKLIESSGKMILLDKLLIKFRAEGKKMLIFSQFTMMLTVLEEYLKYKQVKYEKIDGQIKARERQNAIDRFNDPSKCREVFLLSTKAGGQGINLTAAEIVVIYDSDWNPQNDVQATARAHRIGQSKEVTVYRLVTKDTYEAEMFGRAIRKLGLDQAIFMGGHFKNQEATKYAKNDRKLSKQDMEVLLKNGIIGLINNDNPDFYEQDIDQILEKNSRMAKYSLVNGSYTVSKQSFVSEKTDKTLSLQDPNFWKIILKNQESKAQKLQKQFDLLMSLQEQKKYLEEVGDSVNLLIESKLNQANYSADDEQIMIDLLNQINASNFAKNYRELALTWIYELGKPSRRIKRVVDMENTRKPVRISEMQGEDARRLAAKSKEELIKKLCYVCERNNCSYFCMGHCRRAFHSACKDLLETSEFVNVTGADPQFLESNVFPELSWNEDQLKDNINIRYACPDCRNNVVVCLLCKVKGPFYGSGSERKYQEVLQISDDGDENEPTEDNVRKLNKSKPSTSQLSKCSTANCNRYFHLNCIQANSLSKMLDSNNILFRCPSHVCVFCRVNSSNMTTALIHCVRCTRSFHSKCAPTDVKNKMEKIGKKVMICDMCSCNKVDDGADVYVDTKIKISLKDYPNPKKLKQVKLDFKISGTTERTRRLEQQKLGLQDQRREDWSRSNSLEQLKKKVQKEKRKVDIHPYTYEELGIIPVQQFDYSKFKNDWCRYCGARFASNFTKGPWGSRTLCTIHYINWGQKKTLDLVPWPDLPLEPINRTDPTELQFLQRQKAKDANFDPKRDLDVYNDDSYRL